MEAITICLDLGNTRAKAAVFQKDKLIEEISIDENLMLSVQQVIDTYKPQFSILSSVVNHDPALEALLSTYTLFHKLSYQTRLAFTTPVGKPETIGADRLALIAAAVRFFPSMNNLVIGLGSCITYNFVNQDNEFLGGGISPGMRMRFRSMHEYTARLPLVDEDWNYPLIGYDTKTNLQSGVINGIACELDGIISKYAERYGNFNVVLTGGNSAYFAGQLKNKIFADHNFLFKGLYAISELNNCTD